MPTSQGLNCRAGCLGVHRNWKLVDTRAERLVIRVYFSALLLLQVSDDLLRSRLFDI